MNDFFSKMPNGTCRICGESHDTRFGAPIKYAVRHYAHVECGLKKWGAGFFDRLHSWQLAQLPVFAVKEAGLFEELERRVAATECPECHGRGTFEPKGSECPYCQGSGRRT